MAEVDADSKVSAKSLAADKALEDLRPNHWTILTKQLTDTDDSELTKNEIVGEQVQEQVIGESSVGHKLLQKMGWSGGGIGKKGTGIAEPVQVDQVIRRQGLGASMEAGIGKDFARSIREVLQDYVRSNNESDLTFSPEFSKEERVIIHQESKKLGLKSHSHGAKVRFLVIGRKRNSQQLLNYVLSNGGETAKYVAVAPGGMQS